MITQIKPNIYQLSFENFGSCVYLLNLEKKILIDSSSGQNRKKLLEDLNELKISSRDINAILLTHPHWDHINNIKLFENAKVYDYENRDEISKDLPEINVIETPGHTKDSLCFLYKDILFSGDTLFHNEGIGRTDLQGGNEQQIQESIKKLKTLKYKILCPGHI
jgi:glyoxylase-like metal-dependent hydrolase (beta-lactamase superfamily II)